MNVPKKWESGPFDASLLEARDAELIEAVLKRYPDSGAELEVFWDSEGWFPAWNLPAPESTRELRIRVWSEFLGEPSLGFADWHNHWFWEDFESMFDTVDDILSGKKASLVAYMGSKWKGSWLAAPSESPEYRAGSKGDRIVQRGWDPRHDCEWAVNDGKITLIQ